MENNTISAVTDPGLANDLAKKAIAETTPKAQPADIVAPFDGLVTLPGGFINDAGEVIKTVEVRELNGRDEEAISKSQYSGRALQMILSRATVKIGSIPATDELLDKMLANDRDTVLLGIFRATFGNTASLPSFCRSCEATHTVEVDLAADIKVKELKDPKGDREFVVKGKKEYSVSLPDGALQRELWQSTDKTVAELTTLLLERTVHAINGNPVFSKTQVQEINLADRRLLGEEIGNRSFGPEFDGLTVSCPDCGGEVVVPINLGTLFRL